MIQRNIKQEQFFNLLPKKHLFQIISLIILCNFIMSCDKDEAQARNSVEGMWEVTSIQSVYNGFTPSVIETGQLGVFDFTTETVDFNFTRNDTTYTGNSSWNLVTEKVNAGFTKVNQHTLTITGDFVFEVTFGDDTNNAEKNATEMRLVQAATVDAPVFIEVFLVKG